MWQNIQLMVMIMADIMLMLLIPHYGGGKIHYPKSDIDINLKWRWPSPAHNGFCLYPGEWNCRLPAIVLHLQQTPYHSIQIAMKENVSAELI